MKRSKDYWKILFVLLISVIAALWSFIYVSGQTDLDPGVVAVKLMYEFSSPSDLADRQEKLKQLLTDSEYMRLSVDNELRMVNTYFKFGYSASSVEIVSVADGVVVYRLHNKNIPSTTQWLFMYDMSEEGKLHNIREYEIKSFAEGGKYE